MTSITLIVTGAKIRAEVNGVLGGTVYGMAVGTATITATTRNGNTAACTVTVTD